MFYCIVGLFKLSWIDVVGDKNRPAIFTTTATPKLAITITTTTTPELTTTTVMITTSEQKQKQ